MMSFQAGDQTHRIIIHDAFRHRSMDQNAMRAWLDDLYPGRLTDITHAIGGGLHLVITLNGPAAEAEDIATHFFLRWR